MHRSQGAQDLWDGAEGRVEGVRLTKVSSPEGAVDQFSERAESLTEQAKTESEGAMEENDEPTEEAGRTERRGRAVVWVRGVEGVRLTKVSSRLKVKDLRPLDRPTMR